MNWSKQLQKYNPFRNYKSFSHWFTYHWRPVVCVVLAVLIWLYFANLPKAKDPDYVVSWVGQQLLSPQEEQALTGELQAAGTDVNGDGEVVVKITQYAITFRDDIEGETLTDSYAYLTKLLNSLQANECLLFLMEDPEGFQQATGVLQYLDGTIPSEADGYECANWQEMCVPFETEALDGPVYLGRRCLFDGEDPEVRFPGADALFAALSE